MPKNFLYCASLKTGALTTGFAHILLGALQIIVGITRLYNEETMNKSNGTSSNIKVNGTKSTLSSPNIESIDNVTFFIVCIVIGTITLCNGIIFTIGIIQAKSKFIFTFLMVGLAVLMIDLIYSGIGMFEINKGLLVVFIFIVFLLYCHYCMFSFYDEVSDYNKVNPRVNEIVFNSHEPGDFVHPEGVEHTTGI